MVRTECVQPLAQALADRILDCADDAFHLPIALAVAGRWLLVHEAKYLTQMRKAPL